MPGDPERVVLIDFDVAKTFPTKELLDQDMGILCPEPVQSCEWELRILEDFGKALVCLLFPLRFSCLFLTLRLGGRSKGGTPSLHKVLLNMACLFCSFSSSNR